MNQLTCCYLNCDKKPDFVILTQDKLPGMETYACIDHVGLMLEDDLSSVWPFKWEEQPLTSD